MAAPLRLHWYAIGAVPAATTANVAICPSAIVTLRGWRVMVGATAAGVTVRRAALLLTLPALLDTTTANVAPLSAIVLVNENAALVAPAICRPSRSHW